MDTIFKLSFKSQRTKHLTFCRVRVLPAHDRNWQSPIGGAHRLKCVGMPSEKNLTRPPENKCSINLFGHAL